MLHLCDFYFEQEPLLFDSWLQGNSMEMKPALPQHWAPPELARLHSELTVTRSLNTWHTCLSWLPTWTRVTVCWRPRWWPAAVWQRTGHTWLVWAGAHWPGPRSSWWSSCYPGRGSRCWCCRGSVSGDTAVGWWSELSVDGRQLSIVSRNVELINNKFMS